MSETALRVLIVEDEIEIRRFVRMALEAEGLLVYEADSLQRGLIEAGTRRPDLIVLDLGLPDGDGVDLIRDLRTWSQVPIIVLSARSAESAKIIALDTGADDYLVKPFGTGELLARVRAQVRRSVKSIESTSIVTFGDVRIDMDRRIVERAGVPVHLTPLEYRLLTHLCAHPDRVLTHLQLLKAVWGPSHQADTQYLRVFMGGLRKKIEADPSQPCHLITETGVGYRFVP
ncbi:two-component system response regulator KdpE [Pseudomonas fluorescens]|uniref:KDP operon transcriptional regulatory protein KdpE n=1 Tax=Pseudomonas fluorescens TaxID=294 RepID=A0A5E7EJC9_PSEFL|nr:two-component system response regulator KdpE [Pseudomonas fluorescens]VVO26772.1 KDP operon transcriptional regulatory protein KdpE [Pseudomonas fluorescens]